jgi:hypothetical protein
VHKFTICFVINVNFILNSWLLQVELRDVDTANKTVERFRTDEALESMDISSLRI